MVAIVTLFVLAAEVCNDVLCAVCMILDERTVLVVMKLCVCMIAGTVGDGFTVEVAVVVIRSCDVFVISTVTFHKSSTMLINDLRNKKFYFQMLIPDDRQR